MADNPAYVLVNTQLQATDLELQSLATRRQELLDTIAEHELLIRQAPRVEMQYEALMRTYENAEAKHDDLQAKLRAAEVAANVEQGITGQRFTMIEPPEVPIQAEPRNRIAIMLMGMVFATGVGLASVVLAEFLDHSIRGAASLAAISGAQPLAVIPYLDNSVDIARHRNLRYLFVFLFFVVSGITIAILAN